jgi:hypothetical protein
MLFVCLMGFSSCESYLDKKEDDAMTFEKVWKKRATILQYLDNVYGYIQRYDNPADYATNAGDNGHPFLGAADDAKLSYNRDYNNINNGTWSASTVPYNNNMWPRFYKGIREASLFMQYVETCSDNENVTPAEIQRWKAEARFARAYQYFQLFRAYGSFIITGDEPMDMTQSDLSLARSPLDECVAYLESELTGCYNVLPDRFTESQNNGRATKGVCLALIGRIKLYAARKLFNGNPLYKDVRNHDGTPLFPATPDPDKWKLAADANKALIAFSENNGNIYQLYKDGTGDNPYLNYQGVFTVDWNNELIWARYGGRSTLGVLLNPRVAGSILNYGYGGCSPTQQQVDAYAMKSGVYPITGYTSNGRVPVIDERSGYSANEFTMTSWTHPIDEGGNASYPNMFKDREPRFYVSVHWSSAPWPGAPATKPVYAYAGNSGRPGNDYPPCGYMVRKFVNPQSFSSRSWGSATFPVIRLAEIYLNYVEALNECEPANSDIHKYLNLVRQRAGVPDIRTAYPEVATLGAGTQEKMRELIRRERQVELFFECHRYFDARQWMIMPEIYSIPVYGMNIMAQTSNESTTPVAFWERTVAETRVFKPAFYLYPIRETELTRNKQLVQNYGW